MTISVLIPTLGRREVLIETVKGLLNQTLKPLEIIIVDQNDPEIPEVNHFLETISLVKHIKKMPQGVVPNYNRCLQQARGDIVLFVDDDVMVPPDLTLRHMEIYERAQKSGEKMGGVAGKIKNAFGDQPPQTISLVGTYLPWQGKVMANFNGLQEQPVDFGQGANMSFNRRILNEVGGFDTRFDGNGYFFETDVGLRLKKAGYPMVFSPLAQLDHLQAPSGGARINDKSVHTYHFMKNGVRLYRRHSPALGLPFFIFRQLFYLSAKSAFNLNPKIFLRGLKGLFEGFVL